MAETTQLMGTPTSVPAEAQSAESAQNAETVVSSSADEQVTTGNILGDNYDYVENWQQIIADRIKEKDPVTSDMLRADATLSNFKNLPSTLRGFIETKRMVGADTIIRPKEDSDKSVWETYYKAGGLPETPQDYKIELPEQIQEQEDIVKSLYETAHNNGLNNNQLKGLVDFYQENILQKSEDQLRIELENERIETEKKLLSDWGNAKDQNLNKINQMLSNLGIIDVIRDNGLGNNYEIAKAFMILAEKVAEPNDLVGAPQESTPLQIETEIEQLSQNFNRTSAEQQRLDYLFQQKYKNVSKAS